MRVLSHRGDHRRTAGFLVQCGHVALAATAMVLLLLARADDRVLAGELGRDRQGVGSWRNRSPRAHRADLSKDAIADVVDEIDVALYAFSCAWSGREAGA